jgi:hypothetical protein
MPLVCNVSWSGAVGATAKVSRPKSAPQVLVASSDSCGVLTFDGEDQTFKQAIPQDIAVLFSSM